jgi:hypothetical protein
LFVVVADEKKSESFQMRQERVLAVNNMIATKHHSR